MATNQEVDTPDARTRRLDALFEAVAALHAEIAAEVVVADESEDWKADGAHSMASWLAYRYRLAPGTARDWVTLAHGLAGLPGLRAAFAAGDVSFDQLRHVLVYATPERDAHLAEAVGTYGVAQLEREARRHRALLRPVVGDAQRRRAFRLRRSSDGVGSRISGWVPTEQEATIRLALDRRAREMTGRTADGARPPYESCLLDALVDLAAEDLAAAADRSSRPDAAVVVFHVDVDANGELAANTGRREDGAPLADTAVLRRLCDTRIEFHVEGPDGATVGIGRADREPPRWLRRRVVGRDGGCCRWPGCSRPIRQLHHLRHWMHDGPTDAANLIGVCWFHHHLLHEGGWHATGNADGEVIFRGDLGRTIRSRAGPIAA